MGFHLEGGGRGDNSKGAILAVMSICLVPNCTKWTLLALVFLQTPYFQDLSRSDPSVSFDCVLEGDNINC